MTRTAYIDERLLECPAIFMFEPDDSEAADKARRDHPTHPSSSTAAQTPRSHVSTR